MRLRQQVILLAQIPGVIVALVRMDDRLPAVGLALAVAAAGCAGSGDGLAHCGRPTCQEPGVAADAGTEEAFFQLAATVFGPTCARTCHTRGQGPLGLVLDPGAAWDNLVGVPAVQVPALVRVEPFEDDASYVVVKLEPADPRRVGDRMPRSGPPYLKASQIRQVRAWIAGGALPASAP